ncbi:MAG: hypothetical protein WC337_07840 [Candidatus Muiribacteriota bacterium]
MKKLDLKMLEDKKIKCFFSDNNQLLIGTDRGFGILTTSFQFRTVGQVNSIVKNRNGRYMIATNHGIYVAGQGFNDMIHYSDKNSFFSEYHKNRDLSIRLLKVNSLNLFDEKIILGTDEGLVIAETDLSKAKFFYGNYIMPTMTDDYIIHKGNSPLTGNLISSLLVYEKEIFIGTNGGLNVFSPEGESWRNYTANHLERIKRNNTWTEVEVEGNSDLSGNFISTIAKAHNKNIFVGSSRGVDIFDTVTRKITEKLSSDSIVFLFSSDNRLYVATEYNGLNIYEYKNYEGDI